MTADTSQASSELNKFSSKLQGTARSLGAAGATMTAGFTLPLVAAGAAVFDIGKDFESAFTGVIKTFSGTAAEAAVLRQGIRDMSMELPASAVEIAGVAEAAGALGITKENVLGFTRTIIDMGEATDLTAEQAANDMARIANIMGMPQDQFDRMGSTIVALGNAGASTESEIVSMAMRISGAGSVIGLSEAQVLGWSSAMSSVGINAEAGGTAFSRVVVDMAKEVATGGKNLNKFAKVAGVSSAAFVKAFEEDASAATLMFIEGLGGISDAGGNVFGVLEELGLADVRVQDTLLRLAGAQDLVTDSLTTADRAWEENIALTREAELRYATTDSKMAMMKNRIKDVGITLFDTFKPAINAGIDGVSDFALGLGDAISGFAEANPALVSAAAAFAGVLAVAGPLVGVAAGVAFALSALGTAAAPILLVVGAVALLAAGIVYLDSIGVIDLGAMWTTAKTKIDEAIASVKAWTTQIQTQGFVSQETFFAAYELPDGWQQIMQFTIGMGAALKLLSGAVTGDLGAAEVKELNTVLTMAFGEEIATRISNIATHIGTLKDALADASTVGEWFTGVSSFATNVGTEIQAIADDAKAQIKTAMEEIDVNITIGAANITWSEDIKALELGPFNAIVTPELSQVTIDKVFQLKATPKWTIVEAGPLRVVAQPNWTQVGMGPLSVQAKPNWTLVGMGPLTVLVTPEFVKANIGESFGLTVSAGGKIEVKLGASDFNVDFSVLVSTVQIKLATLSGEISSAFASEGWSGLGALAVEKITGLAVTIAGAFGPMLTLVQLGLVLAVAQVKTQVDSLFAGEGLTFIDAGKIGDWAQRQVTTAKAQLDTWFGEGNVGSQILDRVTATVGRIEETMAGVGDMAVGEQFNAAVMSILEVIGLVKGVNLDVVTAAATGLTTLTTAVIDFSTKLIGGLNAEKLAEMLGGIATEISAAVKKAFDPANLTELGTSAGAMVTTLVGKLTELLSADEFGTNVGTAVAEATGAMALGATALVGGIVGELSKTPWASFSSGLNKFVGGFVIGVIEEIRKADWSGLVGALQESIVNTITNIGVQKKAAEEEGRKQREAWEETNPQGMWETIFGIPSLSGWLTEQLTPKGEGFFGFDQPEIETPVTVMGWDVAKAGALEVPEATITGTITAAESMQIAEGIVNDLILPTDPVPVTVDPQWTTIHTGVPDFDATPITVPVIPEWPTGGQLSDIQRPTIEPIAVPIVPDKTIPMVIPDYTGPPLEIPVTPKITMDDISWGWGRGASSMADAMGGGSAAIQEISMNVEVASAVAGPSLQPLLMDAQLGDVAPPATMPVIQVKGELVNDLSQAGAGVADAAAQGAAALSSSLGSFSWPSLPTWVWPALPVFNWPALPQWTWPPIPAPTWLNQLVLPRPTWLGELLSWRPEVVLTLAAAPTTPGQLAGGTNYWRGGPTWVGEKGPELLNLPKGSKITDHENSMAAAGGGGTTINVYATVSSDMDMEDLALRITRIQERRGRGLA